VAKSKSGEGEDSGALFSRAYLRSSTSQRDSARFRTRLYARFDKVLSSDEAAKFYDFVKSELGVSIPSGAFALDYRRFFEEGELRDVLDAVSLVWLILGIGHRSETAKNWLAFVTRVFQEENLGYVVNEHGAVRYLVDQEFERTRFAVIEGLGVPRYKAVRVAVEEAFKKLDAEPFDTKTAVRSMFEAVETLCKVLGDHNDDLDERMVQKRIKPIVGRVYGAMDASAQSFSEQTIEGFIKWVNAGHRYRHGQNTGEPHDPPLELTVAFLSQGAAHIRFLIDLHVKKG